MIEVEEVIRSGETVFVTPANLIYRREDLLPVEPAPDILASGFCAIVAIISAVHATGCNHAPDWRHS